MSYQPNQSGNNNAYMNSANQNQYNSANNNDRNSDDGSKILASFFFILTVIAIFVAGIFIYQYVENQEEIKKLKDPQYISELQDKQMKDVLDKIEKHVLITDSEKQSVTIATIVDIESLKNENAEFYKSANNGDRLVVFPTRAFIYRDSLDRIINAASPIINPNKSQSSTDNNEEAVQTSPEDDESGDQEANNKSEENT